MPALPEYVVNVKLAEVLSKEFGLDCRSERIRSGKRPDITCYHKGLIIVIEASYSKIDAERDAAQRIEQGLADLAIALYYKTSYEDVPEDELAEKLRISLFDLKVFATADTTHSLIRYLEDEVEKKAEPKSGWFEGVGLPELLDIIENASEFLTKEEALEKAVAEIRQVVDEFTHTLSSFATYEQIYDRVYRILYRLYGLSVASAKDPDVVFGQAALSILLSAVLYEQARNWHPDKLRIPLSSYVEEYGPIEGLRRALAELVDINYKAAVKTSLEILSILPPGIANQVKKLIKLAVKIAQNPSLLRRDFAGRVYHEITGDIALRKGFATYYTEIPAAYLLASLAVSELYGLGGKRLCDTSEEEAKKIIEKIWSTKLGDLACGSGTLLTASYSAIFRLISALKLSHASLEDIDPGEVAKTVIEEGIYGIDALRYASQIAALNLALMSHKRISNENIYTIYLGYIPEKRQAWLGSLELLRNGERVGGLLAWLETGSSNAFAKHTLESSEGEFAIPIEFNMIIMNPPFTRATGRSECFGEGKGFFGFIADEKARQILKNSYDELKSKIESDLRNIALANANIFPSAVKELLIKGSRNEKDAREYFEIGQAGEALPFLYLAYKYISAGGIIAFVLPRGLLANISWFLARVLLTTKFHVKYIIVSSDSSRGYNFSEGVALSEVLLIAKRKNDHAENEETILVNLLRKPSSALEALALAEEIRKATTAKDKGGYVTAFDGETVAFIKRISRKELIDNVDNWNRFFAFPDPELNEKVDEILEGKLPLGIALPMVKLGDMVNVEGLAVRGGTFHDVFRQVNSDIPGSIPALIGGAGELRERIFVEPNSRVVITKERYKKYAETASCFLVPDRIRANTAHAIALYSSKPVVSNTFFGLKPKDPNLTLDHLKAIVLWLNTTWGLLTVLCERTETEGPWMRLTVTKWRLLQVPDFRQLNPEVLGRISQIFDECAEKVLKRLPEQFDPADPDPTRLEIDIGFIKALNPSIGEDEAKKHLLELYRHVHIALRTWVSGKKRSKRTKCPSKRKI